MRVRRDAQPLWVDPESGFRRRTVSPPAQALSGEALECELAPGTTLTYDLPPRPGLEHHLLLRDGRLTVRVAGHDHALQAGDCLRYRLDGPSAFTTPADAGARYVLFLV